MSLNDMEQVLERVAASLYRHERFVETRTLTTVTAASTRLYTDFRVTQNVIPFSDKSYDYQTRVSSSFSRWASAGGRAQIPRSRS